MAIPASELVKITPRVLAGGPDGLNFNGLFLTTAEHTQVDTLLTFNTPTEVALYFGYDSAHYKAAQAYFNGYDNSLAKPGSCFFFRHVVKDAPAFIRGRPTDDEGRLLSDLTQIKSGALNLRFGSWVFKTDTLDFTMAKSLDDVAQIVEDAINDAGDKQGYEAWQHATVEYSSLTRAFQLTSGTAGPQILMDYAEGNAGSLLGFTKEKNAIVSAGALACTYNETMDAVRRHTGNFVTYTTIEEIWRKSDATALAEWANQKYPFGDQYLYCFYTSDVTLDQTQASARQSRVGYALVGHARVSVAGGGVEIISEFQNKNYNGVTAIYGDVRYSAFTMGAIASIDWNKPNSVISLAYKSQSGLEPSVTDIQTANKLEQMNVNYVGSYATRNDNFVFSMRGCMFGAFKWIDSYINSTWLINALQAAIMSGFAAAPNVPYTDDGMSLIKAWCYDPLARAKNNGIISAGITLTNAQRNTLIKEAGSETICNNLEANGWHLKIESNEHSRSARSSPTAMLWYTDGGSVIKFSMPVTTVQ